MGTEKLINIKNIQKYVITLITLMLITQTFSVAGIELTTPDIILVI